jgi:O-antigen/teichoic acid export membrane protein
MVLLVAVVLGNHGSIAGIGLSARGRPGLRSAAESIALGVNLVLIFALVPAMGAMGAALATVVAYTAAAVWNLTMLRQVYGVPPTALLGIRAADLTLLVRTARGILTRRSQSGSAPLVGARSSDGGS